MQLALSQIKEKLFPVTVSTLFILFVVMLPRYTDTAKTWFVLLILLSLVCLPFDIGQLRHTRPAVRWFFAAIVANFIWIAVCYYANGEPGRGDAFLWGRHFYFLFAVPLYFLFRRVALADRVIVFALFAGVLLSLGDILMDLVANIDHRLQGMNPNAFGPIQLCLSGMLFFYFLEAKLRSERWAALAGASMGFATVILSMSKSTWLTFTVLGLAFVFYLNRSLPIWKRAVLAATLLLLVSASYLVPIVENRVNKGLESIQDYYASDDFHDDSRLGSFGTRVELWKTGWNIFLENPVLGVGVGGFKVMARANSERYGVNDVVHRYKYVHNQYLAALATRGFPGLLLFLLVMALPLYIAVTSLPDTPGTRAARLSIVFIVLTYLIGCLAEDHFEGKSATMFTGIMLPLLLAKLDPRKPEPGKEVAS